MTISSPGIGSGLDVNGIVAKLMQIESLPLTQLQNKEASYQAKLSAYGTLKSALSSFQSALQGLSDVARFRALKATPTDTTILSAQAGSSATAGTYSIEVTQLAQAQKLVAVGQADTTSVIGTGTLTFDFGTISGGTFDPTTGKYTGATFTSNGSGTKTVTIDSAHSSLAGIRDAINAANIGVTATIVNNGGTNPYRLVLTSNTTGQKYSMKITVSGDAALANFLTEDPAGTQDLSQTVAAQDAQLKVDGISITRSSNTITDVIQGVTLNLLKTNAGSPTTLTVGNDTAAVQAAVESFVKAYNDINKTLNDLTFYDPNSKKSGPLQGDSTVRMIASEIRDVLSSPITAITGAYTSLGQIGITTQSDGSLQLDTTQLQSAMASNFKDIAALFAATGSASDSLVSYVSATSKTQPGSYALSISQLATQGKSVGSVVANTTITAGTNDTLNLTIDGVSASVTLTAGSYTADTLATMVQSVINGNSTFSSAGVAVTVTQSGGVLTITSNRYGSASVVHVTGGNGAAGLMGTPTETAGVDVAGTINGVAATGSGQYLTGATGTPVEGLQIKVIGGALGSRGTVNYSQGYAYQLNQLANTFLESGGTLSTRTDGINSIIADLKNQEDDWNRRLSDIESRYRAQFTALDTLISSMNQTSAFLQQQLATLPKLG